MCLLALELAFRFVVFAMVAAAGYLLSRFGVVVVTRLIDPNHVVGGCPIRVE